tara:strand:- start:110 stop:352 length:243 start_codon:yes stop_codon:yes gene_type:complete
MSTTYDINEHNEVVPYTDGRRCNDTRAYRDATELELSQRDEIAELEKQVEQLASQLEDMTIKAENYRCDANDWKGEALGN